MKDSFSLAILQSDLYWEDKSANFRQFGDQIKKLKSKVDLVVLPETFSTGFSMHVEQVADRNNEARDWMIQTACKNQVYLAGSVIVREEEKYYNRLFWVDPAGNVAHYDKRHLYRMGGERDNFTPGTGRVVVKLGTFRILLQVCYDLRFPVFARNRGDYDVILYVANWPSTRQNAWDTLLLARAIENQAFVIGANRTGVDGEGGDTCGSSVVVDPKGYIKARLNKQPGLLVTSVSMKELNDYRKKFPAYEDADPFTLL